MARILFVVNEHPTEAFSIPVARETAKLLRKAGHTITFKKFSPEDSAFGVLLKNTERGKFVKKEVRVLEAHSFEEIFGMTKSRKYELIYTFHCTPYSRKYWQNDPGERWSDFRFVDITPKMKGVEIRAKYKSLPKRVYKRIRASMKEGVYPGLSRRIKAKTYSSLSRRIKARLRTTTSIQLTRKAGLHPEDFAEPISKTIQVQIKEAKTSSRKRRREPWPKQQIKRRKITRK